MNFKLVLLLFIMLTTTFWKNIPVGSPNTQTTITFDPRGSYPQVGLLLTVDATVLNVTNLSAWQLLIYFNPSIVNCVDIAVPPDNIFNGNYILFPTEINNTKGYVKIFCVLDGTYGVNGSGILCQITFQCLVPGVTSLEIKRPSCPYCGTYLQEPDYDLIPFSIEEGTIEVTDQGFQEYWFNLEVQPILIYSNSTITAFYCNETWKELMFDASGSAGTRGSASVVAPKSIINGTRIIVLIDSRPQVYTLSQNATHNFIHFIYEHSIKHIQILVTLLGDVNGDRKVRVDDVLAVALSFGLSEGDPGWNPSYDLNDDGKIRVDDILIVAEEFGDEWKP